jgi:hypothetical protein
MVFLLSSKTGIGKWVLGDEIDETDRKAFGLPHYQYGLPQGRQG